MSVAEWQDTKHYQVKTAIRCKNAREIGNFGSLNWIYYIAAVGLGRLIKFTNKTTPLSPILPVLAQLPPPPCGGSNRQHADRLSFLAYAPRFRRSNCCSNPQGKESQTARRGEIRETHGETLMILNKYRIFSRYHHYVQIVNHESKINTGPVLRTERAVHSSASKFARGQNMYGSYTELPPRTTTGRQRTNRF